MFTTGCSHLARLLALLSCQACVPRFGKPLWGGRGWSAWLLLFVEKFLEWVRQEGGLFLLQPLGTAGCHEGGLLTYSQLLHLPKATPAIKSQEVKSPRGEHYRQPWPHPLVLSFPVSGPVCCFCNTGFLCKRSTAEPHPQLPFLEQIPLPSKPGEGLRF